MSWVEIDLTEFREFFNKLNQAAKADLKPEMEQWLEGIGMEFLRILTKEFTSRHRNTGSGALVSSFRKGDKNNVWQLENDGLTLEVGTNVEYAQWANDDHNTLDPEKNGHFKLPNGEIARFVPGYWNGKRFVYTPGADTGMVLKYHKVDGIHFWGPAMAEIQKIFQASLNVKLQEWIERYFG